MMSYFTHLMGSFRNTGLRAFSGLWVLFPAVKKVVETKGHKLSLFVKSLLIWHCFSARAAVSLISIFRLKNEGKYAYHRQSIYREPNCL